MATCKQIESLLQAYVDDELGAAEKAVLEQHLDTCAACQASMQEHRANAALLFETFQEQRLEVDLTPGIMAHLPEMDLSQLRSRELTWRAKHPSFRLHPYLTWMPVVVPLLLMMVALTLMAFWPESTHIPTEKIGMVTYRAGDVRRSLESSTVRERVSLMALVGKAERFETDERSQLVIGLAGPTTIKLDNSTRIKVANEREIQVETGQVWLNVSKDERYFRVRTPVGDVTVFGTTFNVEVTDACTTVTVVHGTVQVENDVAFTVLHQGDQVAMRMGQKPLKPSKVDAIAETQWAAVIHPNPKAVALFSNTINPIEHSIIRADQVFVVENRNRALRTIVFSWEPDTFVRGHSGYYIYVSDNEMTPVFKDYIPGEWFDRKEQPFYELSVPADVALQKASVLHINLIPDHSSGVLETTFTEVSAISTEY